MYYVYIIQSINFPEILYVCSSSNVLSRIETHNNGGSVHTKKYKPWDLIWSSEFKDKNKAREFEQYLKSHAGRAFIKKRLI